MTTAREAGGDISRASEVQVFVLYSDEEGVWLPISKPQARQILDDAKAKGQEVHFEMVGKVARIGIEHTLEDDDDSGAAEPMMVCSKCQEPWEPDHECAEGP